MAPLHAMDEVEYNAKMLSEKLSKLDDGSVTEIPASYITSSTDRVTTPHDSWWEDVPMLDLSEAECGEAGLAKKVVDAFADWGFFALRNHGILEELSQEVQAEGHNFFNLPFEEKKKIGPLERVYGYSGDYTQRKFQLTQWNEALMMEINSTQPEDFANSVLSDGAPKFSAGTRNYAQAVKKLQIHILQLVAIGLGLEKDFFARKFAPDEKPRVSLRWNYYPTCPKPMDVIGARGHTDATILTVLNDGEVGGLQVEKNGEWKGVKPVKGGLVCICGDFLKIWTNARFKSPLHRVVVNKAETRMSTVVFLHLNDNCVLSAPSSLVEDIGQERKYKDFAMVEFYEALVAAGLVGGKFRKSLEVISEAFEIKAGGKDADASNIR